MNPTNIITEKWDYIIILDACRYDCFSRMYSEYLSGNLEKRISMGSSTLEWRDKTFTGFYDDIVYISSNPQITSSIEVNGFTGKDHFHRVYDVWRDGWDDQRGTVLPETITKYTLDIIKKHQGKRYIIHYLQPHAPYLSLDDSMQGFANPSYDMKKYLRGIDQGENVSKRRLNLLRRLLKLKIFRPHGFLGDHPEWILRKWLLLPPKTPMDAVRRKFGVKGLREAYKKNLEIVLRETAVLIQSLSGKIIVTADHGEMLGEGLNFTHINESTQPHLIEIPWLTIEKHGDSEQVTDQETGQADNSKDNGDKTSEEQKVIERLRALGYYE